MELVWKLWILPYNHANLNSHSGRLGQIGIFKNLSDFFKQVVPYSKVVLLPGIVIHFLF
jgi:hypothetical protein